MAGILDNKKRVMDVVVTEEGRRQMTSGKMKIEFVSFTDRHTFYESDIGSGSVNPSDRIFLEATSLPQDSITFETNGSGNILSFPGGDLELDAEGSIYEPSSATRLKKVVNPDIFSSLTGSLLRQTLDSFKNQFLIGTHPFNDVSSSFGADVNHVSFNVDDLGPASAPDYIPDVDLLNPSPFNDVMLFTRHTDYLPPVFKRTDGQRRIMTKPGSAWPDLTGGRSMDDFSDAIKHLWKGKPELGENFAPEGADHESAYPTKTVKLIGSGTPDMNISCQMFEVAKNDAKITKLEMVDTGYWTTPQGFAFRIIFAGKVFIDSVNTPCFTPIFTLIFSNNKLIDPQRNLLPASLFEDVLPLAVNYLSGGRSLNGFDFTSGLLSTKSPDRSGLLED